MGEIVTVQDEYSDHLTLLKFKIDGRTYSFNINWADKSRREWLNYILDQTLTEVRNTAFELGKKSVRDPIRKALEI